MDNWPTVTSRENGWKSQISQTTHFVKWQVNFRSKKWTIWGSKWNVFIKLNSIWNFQEKFVKWSNQQVIFSNDSFSPKVGLSPQNWPKFFPFTSCRMRIMSRSSESYDKIDAKWFETVSKGVPNLSTFSSESNPNWTKAWVRLGHPMRSLIISRRLS